MTSQKKHRCNKSFFIALSLVLVILGVYTIHYRPNSAKSAAEKQHADWLNHMTRERDLQNDTVGYRHYERHEVTQSGTQTGQGQAPISMVMPSNIDEDLHRARTPGVQLQYIPENASSTNKLIEMKLDQTQFNREDDEKDDYKQDNGGDVDDYGSNNKVDKGENKVTSIGQYDRNTMTTATVLGLQSSNVQNAPELQSNEQTKPSVAPGYQTIVQTAPDTAPGYQSNLQNEPAKAPGFQFSLQNESTTAPALQSNVQNESAIAPGLQSNVQNGLQLKPESVSNYTKTNTIQMQLGPGDYVKPGVSEYKNPATRSGYMVDSNVPSYNVGLNNKPVLSQQNPEMNKGVAYGSVLSDTNVQLPNINAQNGIIGDRYRLSQTYQNKYDTLEKNVAQPLLDNGVNRALQEQRGTTATPYTLSQLLERRMSLHKVLKDMQDIVDYGRPATDEENKKPWNVDENRNHFYDVNDKKDLFANLEMQINIEAEPVTGTKPMRPPFKSRIEYPDYLTPINWATSFENVKTPIFECVPMKTIKSYIRICIHPPAVQSEVSSRLKSAASWEYNALMDVQKALLEHRDSILIDIGASFGVFSLAAAALNRNVIAVEPFPSHIQVFKQSVSLNTFREHITLFQAVVSDRRGKVLIKPLGDHVNNVYIQTVEDNEQATNYTLVVNSVTLDDIEKVCPSRIAVLKIDVPGFMKKALEYSHFFFKYIHVTHVFMHWDTQDKELCLFIVRYFVERGYLPYGDLNGNNHLELKDAYTWTNDIVIWKL
ncbi:uncharacterized protein LOC123523999 isoform X2 [Mercenaria mercenaria]|nr:uncharacterized protein LOC123523999 isoform X2 [Mercenaria mercenaria]